MKSVGLRKWMGLAIPRCITLVALIVAVGSLSVGGRTWRNVDYVGDGIVGHQMDIHTPDTGAGPFPILVIIYGSAWTADNGKGPIGQASAAVWCPLGFAIASINHRSSGDVDYPAQIHDVKASIRFLRANASTYDIDPDRIGISGGSSGGHLAALAGTSGGVGDYTIGDVTINLEGDLGGHTNTSSRVQAVLIMAASTDFLLKTACDPNTVTTPEENLIGGPLDENVELVGLANPVTYVDSEDPPFRIFHGAEDPVVPHCESAALYAALKLARVPVEYTLVSGAGHNDIATVPSVGIEGVRFFRETLGQGS